MHKHIFPPFSYFVIKISIPNKNSKRIPSIENIKSANNGKCQIVPHQLQFSSHKQTLNNKEKRDAHHHHRK